MHFYFKLVWNPTLFLSSSKLIWETQIISLLFLHTENDLDLGNVFYYCFCNCLKPSLLWYTVVILSHHSASSAYCNIITGISLDFLNECKYLSTRNLLIFRSKLYDLCWNRPPLLNVDVVPKKLMFLSKLIKICSPSSENVYCWQFGPRAVPPIRSYFAL